MTNPMDAVIELLRGFQKQCGWSTAELARKASLSPDEVSAYEAGGADLSPVIATKILRALPKPTFESENHSQPPQYVLDQMDAKVLELEAALRIDEGRLRDALALLDRAFSKDPRPERRGRLLLTKGEVLGALHREQHALEALTQAEALLDPVTEPQLWLRLRLEQVDLLCTGRRHAETTAWYREASELATRVGRDKEQRRARLLGGWIAAATGRTQEALDLLRGVRDELNAIHYLFDATAVEIDIAALLAEQGQAVEVTALADPLESRMRKIPKDACTPLKVFCWAARRGSLTADMARRLAAEFRKAGGRLTRPYEIPI